MIKSYHMKTMYLLINNLSPGLTDNRYFLSVAPNPDLGLSMTPISKHSFKTLDEIYKFVNESTGVKLDTEEVGHTLQEHEGKPFVTEISDDQARRMGFQV